MLKANKKALHIAILSGALLLAGCGDEDLAATNGSPVETVKYNHIGITANYDDSTVTLFDADTMAVTHAAIALSGAAPSAITLSTDNKTAYVSNSGSDDISIIDLISGTEMGVIGLSGDAPGRSIIAPDGYLYVTFGNSSFIAKVDIVATTPAEVDTFEPSTVGLSASNAIVATPDGQSLYAAFDGGEGDSLVKFDVALGDEVDAFSTDSVGDLEIDSNGILYVLPSYADDTLYRFDTNSDEFADEVELTYSDLEMNDLHLYNGTLFAAVNAEGDSGGVAEVSATFDPNSYAYDSDDDSDYDVALGFNFNFLGTDYSEVSMNSNGVVSFGGYVSYGEGLNYITGFTPNNEDLDSRHIFNYSSRVANDYVVFQWLTNTYDGNENVNAFTSFEVVLYRNGQARFDYLLSGPDAIEEDDGSSYGVGDEEEMVNLRDTLDSPFSIERKSYLWDPATPNTMTEVPFAWEGTGIHFNPAILSGEGGGGYVSGVGASDDHIFMTTLHNYNGDDVNAVVVYDRDTMLPLDTPIAVGAEPCAIAIAKIVVE